jgi:hypothetical protein
VPGPVHEFGGGGTCCSRESQPGVPQIMQMKVSTPNGCARSYPRCLQYISHERYARLAREDQGIGTFTRVTFKLLDDFCHQKWRHGKFAIAGSSLWLLHERATLHREGSTLLHMDFHVQDVNVFAAKTQDLTPAKLAPRSERHDQAKVFRHCKGERLYFGQSGDRSL